MLTIDKTKYDVKEFTMDSLMTINSNLYYTLQKVKNFQNTIIPNEDIVVSGSFVLYLYSCFQNPDKQLKWIYKDIDLYVNNSVFDTMCDSMINDKNKIVYNYNNANYNKHTIAYQYRSIKYIENVVYFKLQNLPLHMDLINITMPKDNIHTVIDNFDIDCCKIALNLNTDYNTIQFIIHKDFYNDSYKILNKKSKSRVEKYKSRGYVTNEPFDYNTFKLNLGYFSLLLNFSLILYITYMYFST